MSANLDGAVTLSPLVWEHSDPGEDVLLGTVLIYGVYHHAQAIRVTEDPEGIQVPTKDPHDRWADVCALYDVGPFYTVEIPGHPGDWVIWLHPFAH